MQLRRQNITTYVTTFQELASKVYQIDTHEIFIPWNSDKEDLPNINTSNILPLPWPFKLTHYLGHYNKNKTIPYGRAKLQARLHFKEVMEGILLWLQGEIHWVKLDYIQAKQKSTIGVLYGSMRLVDRDCTRALLEEAVFSEIGQTVPMEVKLQRISCKTAPGCRLACK